MSDKMCNCSGNSSLRYAIGGPRCGNCGALLNEVQTTHRIISQLNEIDETLFEHIGALQRLGADKCDVCGEWELDTWNLCDHCMCKRCLEANPSRPLWDEDLNEKEYDDIAVSIVKFLTSRGIKLRIHDDAHKPELQKAYQKVTVTA